MVDILFTMDQPASIRFITGSTPGLLDASQLSRLVGVAGSSFTFASYDQGAVSSRTKVHQSESSESGILDVERLCRLVHKRIVIETSPDGISKWRFVPPAKLEDGAVDDNIWPKVVEICG